MSIAAVTVLLCSLVAASAAAPNYPEPFQTTEIQSRYTAPSLGCVEIRYRLSRVYYRSYVCDGPQGMCLKLTTCLIVIIISDALHGSWSLDVGSM